MQHDRDTLRHFVLWSKGHYSSDEPFPGNLLIKIIAKITGIPEYSVSERHKIYWLRETCKEYGIDGYNIISNFMGKSYGLYDYGNEIEQMVAALRSELTLIQVKEQIDDEWITLVELGEPDLFEEESE